MDLVHASDSTGNTKARGVVIRHIKLGSVLYTMSQTVIITGGSSGIGRATAQRYAAEDYHVGILDTRSEPREGGRPTHELIAEDGGDVFFIETNVRDHDSVAEAFDLIADQVDSIDVLVNNAGFAETGAIDEFDDELWHKIMEINLDGVFYCTQEALPMLADDAAIVNISSVVGKKGAAGLSAYSASKFGVIGFTESISKELDTVRVNAVCPRRTKTAMTGFEGDLPERVADIIVEVSQADQSGEAITVGD